MMHVGLVACAATKLDHPAPARELYASDLFQKAAAYCDRTYDRWYVLSAKHGLVRPDQVIEPYDLRLDDLSPAERRVWGALVLWDLLLLHQPDDPQVTRFHFHAGELYRNELARRMTGYEFPLRGRRIGEQLAWYAERLNR